MWPHLFVLASVGANDVNETVVVETTLGPVEGNAAPSGEMCASFYGIPYAAAPIGSARFQPPRAAKPWADTKKAFTVGPSCLQTFGDSMLHLPLSVEEILEKYHIGEEVMDEDCLYLNVFSPSVPTETKKTEKLKPIMIWFHGGSYMGGSGDMQSGIPMYDGKHICAEGRDEQAETGTVVVTVNYRLGIFGFYASEELRKEGGTAGNMGIQVLIL